MPKAFTEFGGWLRFFQVTCWINVGLSLLALYKLIMGYMTIRIFGIVGTIFILIDVIIGLYFYGKAGFIVPVKSVQTPD